MAKKYLVTKEKSEKFSLKNLMVGAYNCHTHNRAEEKILKSFGFKRCRNLLILSNRGNSLYYSNRWSKSG